MTIRIRWSGIALAALLGGSGFACTITSGGSNGGSSGSGDPTGSGGTSATGSGGTTSSGGTTGTGGSTTTGAGGGCVASSGGSSGSSTGGTSGAGGGTPSATMGPCDIYAADGGACVAAHSTVRALYAAYNGPLYQVRRSDCATMDIGVLTPGGFANAAAQDTFCGSSACTISIIYDQSGSGNHLTKGPPAQKHPTAENEANAKAVSFTISGQKVYGVHIVPGVGYRNNAPTGTAKGDNPETEYMVVAATYFNGGCCFDYGNMETTSRDDGDGTMEAVYFGNCTTWNEGGGNGPWVMGDLEDGLWAGNSSPYDPNMSVPTSYAYITGMVKGDDNKNHWTIKEGNAASGTLSTPFDGTRPSSLYYPMKKEGAIGLGTGGDGTSAAEGNWFEGVMTGAYSSDSADNAVQANIVSVYGQ